MGFNLFGLQVGPDNCIIGPHNCRIRRDSLDTGIYTIYRSADVRSVKGEYSISIDMKFFGYTQNHLNLTRFKWIICKFIRHPQSQ